MNGPDASQKLIAQIATVTEHLRDVEASLKDIKLHHEKKWLKRLQHTAQRTSKHYQLNLPNFPKKLSQQWFEEATSQLATRYQTWIEALNAIVDRAKDRT